MSRVLIILTDKYPYGTGETFIENEREYWTGFDQVFLCPVILSSADALREGFECKNHEKLIITTREQYRRSDGVKTLLSYEWERKLAGEIKNLRKSKKLSVRNIRIAVNYAVRSHQRASLIGDELAKYISPNDDIAVYAYWFLEPALVGCELSERFGSKTLFSRAHRYDLYEERHANAYLPFRKLLLDSFNRVCPISTDGRNYILEHYGNTFAAKTFIERLGTIRHYPINGSSQQDKAIITLVSCSAISPVKRVHLIVDALMHEKKKVRWIHFGDGELRRDIEQMIKELPPNVEVELKGFVENKDIQKYYSENEISAFLNVSSSEGVPVSIMEAQSYGIPVIATDVGGTSELVHDQQNGILLRQDFCCDELLDAVNLVSENYELYKTEALRTWECLSNAETIYRDFFDLAIKEIS